MIRNENPRPYLLRENELLNLNGEWNFDFDDNNIGHKEKWFEKHYYSKKIEVPFPFLEFSIWLPVWQTANTPNSQKNGTADIQRITIPSTLKRCMAKWHFLCHS